MPTGISWGSVADWVSGIGSVSACITALYLANANNKIRLYVSCGEKVLLQDGYPNTVLIMFRATNTCNRSTVITSISFSVGRLRKRYCTLTILPTRVSDPIPRKLIDGEDGRWGMPTNPSDPWYKLIFPEFITKRSEINSLRVIFSTSNGGQFITKPDKSFRDGLAAYIDSLQPGPA